MPLPQHATPTSPCMRTPVRAAIALTSALSIAAATAVVVVTAAGPLVSSESQRTPSAQIPVPEGSQGPQHQVRHIVVFKYKPDATPEQIQEVTEAFAALKTSIPGITAFEHGVNNSPENKNLGFTHAYVMTFTDAAARDAYLPHPEHRKFGQLLARLGIVDGAFVVDYVPQS